MARPLTDRQTEIVRMIDLLTARQGYPPTLRELGEALGIRSTNGVTDHLKAIEAKGFITRGGQVSRALQLTPAGHRVIGHLRPIRPAPEPAPATVEIPFFGRVAAGTPILASDRAEEKLVVDQSLLPKQTSNVFALKIKGDSMIGDGILEGDIVFVRGQSTATVGALVVAMIEGEATVKRYYPEGDTIRFQPSNPSHTPILVHRDDALATSIAGVVVGLYRRM